MTFARYSRRNKMRCENEKSVNQKKKKTHMRECRRRAKDETNGTSHRSAIRAPSRARSDLFLPTSFSFPGLHPHRSLSSPPSFPYEGLNGQTETFKLRAHKANEFCTRDSLELYRIVN
ncbi:hypothetical protein PUN28_000976 [Cardiocondyla obscurior]|uniref:Uncharacterized protein n=1 Tax=Cardiocondyla obscurior TaxID=286306 RepID=A0AAW2H2C9_9HYME